MKIKWYAADGYVGRDRPQFFELDPAEFAGMSRDEVAENLAGYLNDDFVSKVVPEFADEEGAIDEIMAAAAGSQETE